MATESAEDKDVDALIAQMRSTLNKLEAAQRKDVDDEESDDEPEPKNLQEAERKAQRQIARRKSDSKSE